jgi:RNA-directed DNA polymerase
MAPWPAPITRNQIQPKTRLQEREYEVTVPAVGDRVAQTVAAMALEPRTEALFHEDSYGYRPRKGALDAVGRCRERCWARDWGAPG